MINPSDTTKSVHLSASAGSGKTRALKDRYLALLDALENCGLNIDQAVAITFTEKAAAEIKERVMRDLSEPMLKKIIRGRNDLRISTIHSFCMNLLKRYPLEAGLPPDFGLLDARDQKYKIQKAIEDTLEASNRMPGIMTSLRDFTADDLARTLEFLLSIRSKLKRMEIDAGGEIALIETVRFHMEVERFEAELKSLITSPLWQSNFHAMGKFLESETRFYNECKGVEHIRLAAMDDIDAPLKSVLQLASIYFNKNGSRSKKPYIPKTRYEGKNRAKYEKLFFDLQAMLEQFQSLHARVWAGREAVSLLKLFQLAEKKYQIAKLREGMLDFDDLEIYAYHLLKGMESTDILYWLDRKILHFLVDEFQDTSDIQWAILSKLTEEIFAGEGADKRMRPTLFVVGDEKQSIYRFREANYRLLEDVQRKMEQHILPDSREIVTLDRNFRSTPEIIETVNRVFTALWGEAYKVSGTERTGHHVSVRLVELRPSPQENPATAEALILARQIKSLIARGTILYEPRNRWIQRKAGYADCAILIQSRTRLKEYESALQAENIPYRVIGGTGFYEEDEIQALMNVLFFLWNRDDRLALAAALKSPLFGLTDKDIFDLAREGGNMIDELRRSKPDAGTLLEAWLRIAGLVPLPVLLHEIVNTTGAYVRFGKKNPQAIFNIDKLLDTARDFDRRGYTTLQDFVEWVKNIRETEQTEATADMTLPGFQGSVDIMTVHKAKGLEYPVVFLPGMNQYPPSLSRGARAIVAEEEGRLRMAIKDSLSPVYNELWEREQKELLREHQRLLYVAMTRARDHLIMIGSLNNGKTPIKQNTWLGYLEEAKPMPLFDKRVETVSGLVLYASPPDAHAHAAEALSGAPDGEQRPSEILHLDVALLRDKLSPVPRSDTAEWKKATDFIHREKEDMSEGLFTRTEDRILSPLTRGSVLHRSFEEFTKLGSCDMPRIMDDYPDLEALPEELKTEFLDNAISVMMRVLNTPENNWIFERTADSYSELPFLYKKGPTIVSGVMDRVVVKGDRGFVIDYKAINIENKEALESWTSLYRPQIQIYCEAVKNIFSLRSVDGYLLFLDSNTLHLCFSL